MDAFSNLNLYLPEIIIFLGALISIVSGAFFKNNKYNKVLFLSFMTITISFSFIWPSFCSNRGGLGKVPTGRRGNSDIKWKVGFTWLFIDLVRDLRASEKRA